MGNYLETKEELKTYLTARIPLVVVDSRERERVERMLRELSRERDLEIAYYTDARQVTLLPGGAGKDADHDPLTFAAGFFRGRRGAILALGEVKRASEDGLYSRELLGLCYLALEQAGTLILITPDPVWPRIAQMGMLTVLDPPDLGERRALIADFRKTYGGRYPIEWTEADEAQAALLLRGFSGQQAENILSAMLAEKGRLGREDLAQIGAQKRRLYKPTACLEQVKVPQGLRLSGLAALKGWLAGRKKLFFLPDEQLAAYGLETPKGILLAGIPGCGKSYSAKMVAEEWGLPLYLFDLGGVYNKWVGESERNMKEALRFIDSVAPCVVWIDEIEKALSVSDGGNDTGERVLAQFLFWLQESASRVFLVATANDISQLPPELFRKGRFSEVFFLDLPDGAERGEALQQYAALCLHREIPGPVLEKLVAETGGFSYADLRYGLQEAAQTALLRGEETVTWETLSGQLREILPFAKMNPDAVRRLREWGRSQAVSASGHLTGV